MFNIKWLIFLPYEIIDLLKSIKNGELYKNKRINVFFGSGNNGKTTVIRTISDMFKTHVLPRELTYFSDTFKQYLNVIKNNKLQVVLIHDPSMNFLANNYMIQLMKKSKLYFIIDSNILPNNFLNDHINIIQFNCTFVDNPIESNEFKRIPNINITEDIKLLMNDNLDVYRHIIFLSDQYYKIKNNDINKNIIRFFEIASQLPLELQMILIHRLLGSTHQVITSKMFDLNIKYYISKFMINPN